MAIQKVKLLLLSFQLMIAGVAFLGWQMQIDKYWMGPYIAVGFGITAAGLGALILLLREAR